MPLAPGVRLGPYEVSALIGEGGMGQVYRAIDTNLKRQVALKVLPASLANDAERLARFQREAEVLASLNHPHIAQIHGLEKSAGATALVMELVEGEDLSQRIARGAVPLNEALPIAKQIADALEAAHEQGIIHRDLKPANIKVREDGTVKVLDFGLAKALDPVGITAGDVANSPTITSPAMTKLGMILGTAAYMSPEQARGKPVDKRADIWAFACVLYEMLAGTRPFGGDDTTDVIASIIKTEPAWSALPPALPANVRFVLERCLEKDPKRRLRDIGDLKVLLEAPAVPSLATPVRSPRGWSWWALMGISGAASAAAAVLAWLWWHTPAPDTLAAQFDVVLPAGMQFTPNFNATAISPDGRNLVFGAGDRGISSLWLRPLRSRTARPLQGTEGAIFPFWSPDSRSVAFYQGGKLKRMDIAGGAPQVLCDATPLVGAGGTWNRKGTILFVSQGGLFEVASSGGTPKQVIGADATRSELEHGHPQFLPDGQRFLFFIRSADPNVQGIYAASLAPPTAPVRVLGTERKAFYVPSRDGRSGFLVWLRDQTLVAQPFDVGTLRLEGDPEPVAEDVAVTATSLSRAGFWISDAGVLAYRTGGGGTAMPATALTWLDRQGKVIGTAGNPEVYGELALSPDGSRVAAFRNDRIGQDLWIIDFARKSNARLTTDPGNESYPVWSPDGKEIAFAAGRLSFGNTTLDLYRKPAGTSAQKDLLWKDAGIKRPSDWSRDGRFLLYTAGDAGTKNTDLWVLPMRDAERTPSKYLATEFNEAGGRFSPDGMWVLYTSTVSGRREVYVSPFPDAAAAPAQMVSAEGGNQPRWRPDGRAIFYRSPDSKLMEVEVMPGVPLRAGVPRPLFDAPVKSSSFGGDADAHSWSWDVAPDGQRFLINPPPELPAVPLTVLTNWEAALKRQP